MKFFKFVSIAALLSFCNFSFSQINITPTLGLATPILDNGFGYQIGINPSYELTDYFLLEGQVSYIKVDGTAFLAGDILEIKSFNALAGGRLYILNKQKSFRPFVNFMIGVNYNKKRIPEDDFERSRGISLGVYGEVNNKFLIGISAETYSFLLVKMGYKF